jgi:hypothetical protein
LNSLKDLQRMKRKTLAIGCWEDNWASIVEPVVLRCLEDREAASRRGSFGDFFSFTVSVAVYIGMFGALYAAWAGKAQMTI